MCRARATSAAPSYFKAFKSERNDRGYLDGALYHNNPIRVADLERRLIWPDTAGLPPDILLSIGTSCNTTIKDAARDAQHSQRENHDHWSNKSNTTKASKHGLLDWRRNGGQTRKLFKVMKNRVESILDTEVTWLKFISDIERDDGGDKERYPRINPNIGIDPPKLDETKELPRLQQLVQQKTKDASYKKQIAGVARRLVASCFYVETSSLPTNVQESDISVTGTYLMSWKVLELISEAWIRCRFPSGSREVRYLGEYLKNVTTQFFQPYFSIETNLSSQYRVEKISMGLIQEMMMAASFKVGPLTILISNEATITMIRLSIAAKEELPISGFPRALIPKKVAKGNLLLRFYRPQRLMFVV